MASFDVDSTVSFNIPEIEKLNAAAVRSLELTAAALLSEVKNAQVFPFRTGNLQNESTFLDVSQSGSGVVRIISDTPYARRLYYHPEYNFNHEFNAAARGEWYKPWLDDGEQENYAAETFAKIFKKESGL